MAATTPILIPQKAQDGFVQFWKQACQQANQQWNIRERLRQVDLSYIREVDWTSENIRAKLTNMWGDPTKIQNIIMPIVAPAVESAVAYQTSVFLTGYPIFQAISDPTNEDAAIQMNAILEDQSIRGAWVRHLMMFFRDGFKYNLSFIEADWCTETIGAIETDLAFDGGKTGKPKDIIWSGNRVRRIDPYNAVYDNRCAPADLPWKGEFIGYVELESRIALKQRLQNLPMRMNVTKAFESGVGSIVPGFRNGGAESYYIPQVNPWAFVDQITRNSMDWLAWAGASGTTEHRIAYKNMYEVATLYGRIIPSDFGLNVPSPNTPQVWKFIIVNNQVLVYAERQTNAHNLIPIFVGQPKEDGLMYQTKSLAMDTRPFQDVNSALMSSIIASRRRAISDRVLYDPSRVTEAQINSPNPSAKIPVRPSAYGKPLGEAVYHFPFSDDQLTPSLQVMQSVNAQANTITGQNAAKQGQFVKGNKTLHEYADVMAHANAPDQMVSILYEAQVFTPLKEVLKTNILQYQGGVSLYSQAQDTVVSVDPVALRKSVMKFKISDGLLPSDKIMSLDAFQATSQMLMSAPQLASGYNMTDLLAYLMKSQGADIKPFQLPPAQVAYQQAYGQWQQMVATTIQEFMTSISQKGLPIDQQQQLIKALQSSLPPAPTPQQYGWQPQSQSSNQPVQIGDSNSSAQGSGNPVSDMLNSQNQ